MFKAALATGGGNRWCRSVAQREVLWNLGGGETARERWKVQSPGSLDPEGERGAWKPASPKKGAGGQGEE